MTSQRISSALISNRAMEHLQGNLGIMSKIQDKLSTGKNISRPSDDPIGTTRLVDLSNMLRMDERYKRNIEDSLSELSTTDTSLGNVVDVLHRASELAVKASTFGNSQDQLDAIALEVDNLINQTIQVANTSIGGKHIFAGMKTTTAPFARSGYDVTYSGTDPTDNYGRTAEVAEGTEVTLNLNGQTVFGSVDATASGAPPPSYTFSAGSSGIFKTLMKLKMNLEDGQVSEVRSRIDDLSSNLSSLLDQQSNVGALISRLELSLSRIEDRNTTFSKQYGSIQDIDTAKTITNLNFQQNIFSASLSVTSRLFQTSLMNYL